MLTDVFVNRYEGTTIWPSYGESARRFMVQAAKMVTEQLFPFYINGEINKSAKESLQRVHDKLAMEIGIDPLSPLFLGTYRHTIADVLKNFLQREFEDGFDPDIYIKRRISLVELAFREYAEQVQAANNALPRQLADLEKGTGLAGVAKSLKMAEYTTAGFTQRNALLNQGFTANLNELNERFRQAKFPLSYHNGFVQMLSDSLINEVIEKPFWELIADAKWKNVEYDMLRAVDQRDNGDRDASLSAAKALESTIKIISGLNNWTHGKENGASNYIDNLVSQKNGRFIDVWEGEILKAFFTKVRNPLGHGPGDDPMPALTSEQNSWAIETCMSWIKSLISRLIN
ncbi:AbiJ-NTD4 domain-containing protein [Rhizobium leguminosarum]|uniref:AbiJ-NTD4 domain-containing protein n=1 Tax=Rhizobium leguminosarum TaxID=384 RepID=UPI003F97BDB2